MTVEEIRKEHYVWYDVTDPSRDDLIALGERFGLDLASIRACMEPEHLPKFETVGESQFLILRTIDNEADQRSDTVQSLTRKLALFISEKQIVSIHRKEQPFIEEVRRSVRTLPPSKPVSVHEVVIELLTAATRTYQKEVETAYASFEAFETEVFGGVNSRRLRLKQCYLLKRRVSVMKRMLHLLQSPIAAFEQTAGKQLRNRYRALEDQSGKLLFQLNEIEDGLAALLSLQISIASQVTNEASRRTNEVMRVLTIFSVFFMPLNFMASIYGMNFEHMPELKLTWAYPTLLAAMGATALGIFLWFRRRGWL